jgi:ATP-dependent RNA helicase HelY
MTRFEPDPFQREAVDAIASGESVVVSAPTGSGKTLVAEFAIDGALGRGRKAFYTTPLKALSNQKFNDFGRLYPDVGLLTGDNTINGEAPLVVMTTEVLRNMIYANSPALDSLEVVVLDEVHYLQDPSRGAVWEEIIVHAPAGVQLVCLSATVSNADEFAAWVRSRRGPTSLIQEDRRPVPLVNLYALKDRWDDAVILERMFADQKVNHTIESRVTGRKARRYATPRRNETVAALAARDMLPAIYFIFSRAGCDDASRRLVEAGARFTNLMEIEEIRSVAERQTAHLDSRDLVALDYDEWLHGLEAGIAPHHAGMVPAFKETVEELFARGLVKVVFATETLSLGINMPARTVVLENLSRFTGETHEFLRPGDYTQLTGRAGRRGIDEVGYGVVLHSRYVPFVRVTELARAGSHALASSFRPSYNMAVNLIANYPRDRAERLLGASFGQFLASKGIASRRRLLKRQELQLEELRTRATCERGDVGDYVRQMQHSGSYDVGDILETTEGRGIVVKRRHGKRVELVMMTEDGRLLTLDPRIYRDAQKVGWMAVDDARRVTVDAAYRKHLARRIVDGMTRHPVASCPDREAHAAAHRRLTRLQRRVDRLHAELERTSGSLIDELDRILALLEALGYVEGWSLTEQGERLRSIYSDTDVLLCEAIRNRLLDDLEPAEMASLISMTVYEARRAETITQEWPTPGLAERGVQVESLWEGLVDREQSLRLPRTRPPERGFMDAAYRWASGADLDELPDVAGAGDFVRTSRQLLDVMRQVRDAIPRLRSPMVEAIRAMDRGVVAAPRHEHE